MKKIVCIFFLLLISSHVSARECFVSAEYEKINLVKSCDPTDLIRDVVPQKGTLFDSLHVHEFSNSNLYTITILSPDVGLDLPRIMYLKHEYKKMDGRLILTLLTNKPELECIQYFKLIESPDSLTTIADGLEGPCKTKRIVYKNGLELKYKKIVN